MAGLEVILERQGPRRLLAIDGGGIRAGFSIGVLARIERVLRERCGKPGLVLADYFDFIAGTSVGSVLAAGLSLGMSMTEVREFAGSGVRSFFQSAGFWRRVRHKYAAKGVEDRLIELFGDMELGSPRLRTLLLVILRNASTDSIWPVSNNPLARYNATDRPDCNLRLLLRKVLRSSTAAPTLFPPERVRLSEHEFAFVDGGVTIANNPAFQLFLHATLPEYRLDWPTGAGNMLLVSVGTGRWPVRNRSEASVFSNAIGVIESLLSSASVEQDLLCRLFGNCVAGEPIDREIGDLISAPVPWPKLFTYCRYNLELSQTMFDRMGVRKPAARFQSVDNVGVYEDILELGDRLGETRVLPRHFDGFDAR